MDLLPMIAYDHTVVARRNCLYFFVLRNENVVVDVVQFEVFLLAVADGVADVAGVADVVVVHNVVVDDVVVDDDLVDVGVVVGVLVVICIMDVVHFQ